MLKWKTLHTNSFCGIASLVTFIYDKHKALISDAPNFQFSSLFKPVFEFNELAKIYDFLFVNSYIAIGL